jgi:hypothetical protein
VTAVAYRHSLLAILCFCNKTRLKLRICASQIAFSKKFGGEIPLICVNNELEREAASHFLKKSL